MWSVKQSTSTLPKKDANVFDSGIGIGMGTGDWGLGTGDWGDICKCKETLDVETSPNNRLTPEFFASRF
ncbi:hypothetical protein ACLOJK_033113 [Asimina triloba]